MEKGEAKTYLALGDALLDVLIHNSQLVWDSEKGLFKDPQGDYLEWDDYFTIGVNISVSEGKIQQILCFGDGTIEFQMESDYEPINWAEFKKEDIVHIINQLNSIQNEQESI